MVLSCNFSMNDGRHMVERVGLSVVPGDNEHAIKSQDGYIIAVNNFASCTARLIVCIVLTRHLWMKDV